MRAPLNYGSFRIFYLRGSLRRRQGVWNLTHFSHCWNFSSSSCRAARTASRGGHHLRSAPHYGFSPVGSCTSWWIMMVYCSSVVRVSLSLCNQRNHKCLNAYTLWCSGRRGPWRMRPSIAIKKKEIFLLFPTFNLFLSLLPIQLNCAV